MPIRHEGNNILDGGAGADQLYGYQNNDTYRFGRASGHDTIFEYDGTGSSIDTVELDTGILPADVTFLQNGNDLILALDQGAVQLSVSNYFLASAPNSAYYKIERIQFAGGTVWTGTDIAARTPVTAVNTYTGTTGNDNYVVDNTQDTVSEGLNAGTDTIQSSVTYTLPTHVENLTLTGYFNLAGYGNALDNVIVGNSGNNYLTGGDSGVDSLRGGAGDDTYRLRFSGQYPDDGVVEFLNEGTDTVLLQSGLTGAKYYTLTDNVENLFLVANEAFPTVNASWFITGNALDNVLTGNLSGNDLNGGLGADTMIGGDGNDTYWVDNPGDVVTETGSGNDTVNSTISYTLPVAVEKLVLLGTDPLSGMGNKSNNILDGSQNVAANLLAGRRAQTLLKLAA